MKQELFLEPSEKITNEFVNAVQNNNQISSQFCHYFGIGLKSDTVELFERLTFAQFQIWFIEIDFDACNFLLIDWETVSKTTWIERYTKRELRLAKERRQTI